MSEQPVPFLDLASVNGDLRAEYEAAFSTVLGHGKFIGGPEVGKFEAEFAEYCQARAAVGCGNGTDALELILKGLGIGPGDEVIVPANTFIATVEAVLYVGARPRFVDVLPDTLLIDPDAANAAVNKNTAAVIGVHLFGQMVDIDRVLEVTRRHGIAFIEDAAQAQGAEFDGKRAGSQGVATGFSFYPGKNLGALGDAGAVVTQDTELADKIRRIADHGRSAESRFLHDLVGRNSRMDSVLAAGLSIKLRGLDKANAGRLRAWKQYVEELPSAVRPVSTHPKAAAVHHVAVVEVENRDKVCTALDEAGVGWGLHYKTPCHLDSAYTQFTESLPVVEAAAERILSLPMSPNMTEQQVSRVCEVLRGVTG
ncbi:DegT/DnrJ/EryC1/StrS family aminotransferase [Pseudonocardia spinosispora]|uniref:DegT/DnrJ/EryC1/StrS family aminotransferase n=1 Tax=Pseudonocardia spinosispora TaxID=103441 RepID=UPI0004113BC7|nr:DegT/DnrJ/EryC1/StrS family aminotransferase [Pseudonocardia spinosispora]